MKRCVKIMLIALTIISLLIPPFCSFAYLRTEEGEAPLLQEGDFDVENIDTDYRASGLLRGTSSLTASEYIHNQLLSFPEEFNIKSYGVQKSDFIAFYADVINDNPDLFFVSSSVEFSYNPATGVIADVYPSYSMTASEITEAQEIFNAGVDRALAQIDNSLSDEQIALTLHDYVCDLAHYPLDDLNLYDKEIYHSAYGIFYDSEVVCAGYTLIYSYLMNLAGVPCEYVSSEDMHHAWNYVQIDGNWYNVDCTFDDCDYSAEISIRGSLSHNHFLKSDSAFETQSCSYHYGGVTADNCVASSTLYDNAFWNDIYSRMYAVNGDYYYLKPNYNTNYLYLTKRTPAGAESNLKSYRISVSLNSSSYVTDRYGNQYTVTHKDALSKIAYLDSRFYLVHSKKIYSVNLTGNQYEIKSISDYAGGLGVDNDDNLTYQYYATPDDVNVLDKMTYYNNHFTVEKGVNYNNYPDINYDGVINAKDYAMIIRKSAASDYITNVCYYTDFGNAVTDANSNTVNDNKDSQNAVCSLELKGDKAYIELLDDINCSASVTFNTDADLDFNGHSLTLSEGKKLAFNKSAVLSGGTLSGDNVLQVIDVAESDGASLIIDDLQLNFNVRNNIADKSVCINSAAYENSFSNVTVNIGGSGKSDCAVFACELTNADSVNSISDYTVSAEVPNAKAVTALRITGTSTVENFESSIESDTGIAGGLHIKNAPDSTITNALIYASSNSGNSWGLMDDNADTLYVEGLDITALTGNHDLGMGISLNVNDEAQIVSNAERPVTVFGKSYGLNIGGDGNYIIEGGEYSSENHTAYISANATISNANIFTDKRTGNSESFGFYVGGTGNSVSGKVINLYNVTIGLPDTSKNDYARSLSATSNHSYQTPAAVNIYNCEVYEGTGGFFNYNYPTASNKSNTRFNIYGTTKFYYKNGNTVSKTDFDNGIASWKTTPNYSNSLGKYTQSLGNRYVFGTGAANVNESTGVINEVYLNNGIDVYDLR